MITTLFSAVGTAQMWYFLPLLVSISLVYAATRHEQMGPIFRHAARFAVSISVFLAVVFAILFWMSWML